MLDFDPRGREVALLAGTKAVVAGICSGEGESAAAVVIEQADLRRLAGTGETSARFSTTASGKRLFTVKLQRMTSTNWSVCVDGIYRGAITTWSGKDVLTFDSTSTSTNRPGISAPTGWARCC